MPATPTRPDRLRIAVVGGGPGGLTFAGLAAAAGHDVTLHERRRHGTFGAGVTLWDDHLEELARTAPGLVDRIVERSLRWTGQSFELPGREPVRAEGTGWGTDRTALLELLVEHAERSGLRIERGRQVADPAELGHLDLVVAADGAGSGLRERQREAFGATTRLDRNRFAWLELDRPLTAFHYVFVPADGGWCWAYAYPYRPGAATVVVETTEETWLAERFDRLGPSAGLEHLQALFGGALGGRLSPPAGSADRELWSRFRWVRARTWRAGRTVLLGDAAHTTHFSIGSGTRLAMEDATSLAAAIGSPGPLDDALEAWSASRVEAVRGLVRDATLSTRFFDRLPRYIDREPRDFVRLLERRRSRALHRLPPSAYVALSRARDRARGRRLPY